MIPNPKPTPDPGLVEQILVALDNGAPDEVEALACVIHAPEAEIRAALCAVTSYLEQVNREHARRPDQHAVGTGSQLPPGTRLGSFVLEAVLGQGGMGTVYRARQTTLGDRIVALKVLPRDLAARDPRFIERFRREATLAATIHHPNLAEVYGFETAGDTLCFAMRLVDGRTLHDVLIELAHRHDGPVRPTSLEHVRRCILLGRALADALAEVHARGFVHRDVKPSNVLLEHADPDPVEALRARPVLVDFGLLRPAGDASLTGTHTILGTPAYASHDSLLGRDLDARADVFSLAATLHDLLTSTSPETRSPATAGLPEVRRINPTVDGRLAAILAMALQERKELRYEHGGALRDELDRWLRGDTVLALPTTALRRLRLWARHNPARAVRIGAIALVPALLLCVLFGWLALLATGLTTIGRHAAMCESEGDLLGAANAYRELYHGSTEARLLPWLRDDVERARVYWQPNGALQRVTRHLLAAEEALGVGAGETVDAQLERRSAGFRLIEVLLDPRHTPLTESIEHYFVREADASMPLRRRIAALDAVTDYLLVQDLPQRVPAGLFERLRAILLGPDASALSAELREAAIAALGSIRTVEAFLCMNEVLHQDLTAAQARLAASGYFTYRWLHFDYRRTTTPTIGRDLHERIAAAQLEHWAAGVERHAQRFDPDWPGPVALHLAWWEKDPEGLALPRPQLALSEHMRAEVDRAHAALASTWSASRREIEEATSAEASHPHHRYLVTSGRFPSTYEAGIWRPTIGEDTDVPLASTIGDEFAARGSVRFGRDGAVELSGTVTAASCRASSIEVWENSARGGFLKLSRPGHSQLRVITRVPAGAARLRILLTQMIGARTLVRSNGTVTYRLSLPGRAWRHESVVGDGAPLGREIGTDLDQNDWRLGVTTAEDVPLHVLGNSREVELQVEYLYGNTTWRLMSVELIWDPPDPRAPRPQRK